jgi:hypothetical protein
MNLYDLTNGNYHVLRMISYPEYPESQVVLDVQVRPTKDSEWLTRIRINGAYSGPTDIVSCQDYQLKWIITGRKILELGAAVLQSSSGEPVRQVWSSIIAPRKSSGKFPQALDRFPSDGELISASISAFQIDGNRMSYEWSGTVKKQSRSEY